MNRTLIIAILIAVVGGGYYFAVNQDTVSGSADGALDSAIETASDSADAITDAATEMAAETATITETTGAALEGALFSAEGTDFSAEGYDSVKIGALIDASDLGDSQKSSFKTALQAASDDPALLTRILGQVKEALGI